MTRSLKYTIPGIPTWVFLYNLKHNVSISQLISQPDILTKKYDHALSHLGSTCWSYFRFLLTQPLLKTIGSSITAYRHPFYPSHPCHHGSDFSWTWNTTIAFSADSLLSDFSNRGAICLDHKPQGRKVFQFFSSNKGACKGLSNACAFIYSPNSLTN